MMRTLALAVPSLLLAATAFGQGLIVIEPDQRIAPIAQPFPGGIELRHQTVTVEIDDQVATTTVEQVFYNHGGGQREAEFFFPLPPGANIEQFSMDVNGQEVDAELLDAKNARRIYEDIVRRRRDPGILEYLGCGLLRARIFPIEPNSEKRITLRYTELLTSDAGVIGYRYPVTQPAGTLALTVELRNKAGLANVYSPSHDVEIKHHGRNRAVIGFESTQPGNQDFQLYFSPADDGADIGITLLTFRDGEPDPSGDDSGYFLLLASPAIDLADDLVVPKDIVFVLDTSGSMADGKLDQAKKALQFCLENLNDGDRFDVVRFSTETEPVFGELTGVDEDSIRRAKGFVKGLKPNGGTAIHDAMVRSLDLINADDDARPKFVVFLTDGLPTVGETRVGDILDAVKDTAGGARVFCFGVGTDVNTHLLDRITESTRAASTYVLPGEDTEVKLSRFYTKIDSPVLAHPHLETLAMGADPEMSDFQHVSPFTKMHPGDLPDVFRGDQMVVFGRYRDYGELRLALVGEVMGETVSIERDATLPKRSNKHDFIPRLWATRRVGYLLDEIRLHGENRELRDEATQLARAFGIVTPYTTYLILEDERQRRVPMARRSFRHLEENEPLAEAARDSYSRMEQDVSGLAAVSSAEAQVQLKQATTSESLMTANRYAGGAGEGYAQVVQETRVVHNRTFINNGGTWIDTAVQLAPENAEPIRVVFNSPEYFELIGQHPDAAPWLSVGTRVQLLIDGKVYEIVDES